MKCPKCGYESENIFETCPECGEEIKTETEKKPANPEQKKTLMIVVAVVSVLAVAAIIVGVVFGLRDGKNAEMTDAEGNPVTDIDGEPITLPKGYDFVTDESGAYVTDGWGDPITTLADPNETEQAESESETESGPQAGDVVEFTPPEHIKIKDDTAWKGPGVYRVGKDIKAGEYLIVDTNHCYMSVSDSPDPKTGEKTASKTVEGHMYITVQNGQYLTVERGCLIPASKVEKIDPVDGKYIAGMYKIGQDIPQDAVLFAFNIEGKEAYVEQNKDSSGDIKNIYKNINFEGKKVFNVRDINYVTVKRGWLEISVRPSNSQ